MEMQEKLTLANHYTETSDYAKAEEILMMINKSEPENSDALNLLGILNYRKNKKAESIQYFENSFKLDKNNIDAGVNLVDLYLEKKDFNTAINVLIDLIIYNPQNSEARIKLYYLKDNLPEKEAGLINKFAEFESYLPKSFTFETALACNLKCPECAIGGDMISRTKGYLKYDNFKIIADKIKPFAEYLYLHLWGEPTLNKEIFRMIEYSSKFCRVNISTNGNLVDETMAEKLILSGVRDLIVSIDGFSQEIYQKYRVGGDVNKALKAFEYFVKFKEKYSSNVSISPQFIVFKHNEHEMEAFQDYCNSLGVKPTFKAPYIRTDDSKFQFPNNSNYHRSFYHSVEELKIGMTDCVNPKEVFTVNLDGSVILCCHDYDNFTKVGNLFENDVLEIWNSPIYKKYRWDIIKGDAPEFCVEKCMTYMLDEKINNNTAEEKTVNKKQETNTVKVNLCSGPNILEGYINIDISPNADIVLDLEKELLPFEDESVDTLICISAINYFSLNRGAEIINDVFRVLKKGGIARFATQDLSVLTRKYLDKDNSFFFEKNSAGKDRYPGITIADKFNQWFYGFESGGKYCKYVYDYETLAVLFKNAGFDQVEEKKYLDSRIDNIEEIDNRPEQMFFLEAVKESTNKKEVVNYSTALTTNEESILKLWEDGKKEESWQKLVETLLVEPQNRKLILFASEIVLSLQRYGDLTNILENYLNIISKDSEIFTLLGKVIKLRDRFNDEQEKLRIPNNELNYLDLISPSPKDNKEHLQACMKWLDRAFEINGKKGVAAHYNLGLKEWYASYPETTGYIIPTYLRYSELIKNDSLIDNAIKMGDWEIAIQWENGGVGEPVGVFGKKPRIFNTAQVMLGWIALYEKLNEKRFLNAAIKAGNWLVENQDGDGKWNNFTYMGPKTYHSRVAWALNELYRITGDIKYENAVDKSVNWILSNGNKEGWFHNTSLSDPNEPWTHLIGYTLFGLLEIYGSEYSRNNAVTIGYFLEKSADNIVNLIYREDKKYLGLPGVIGSSWDNNENWTCLTGNAQIEFHLRKFGNLTSNSKYIKAADTLLDEIKKVHLINNINDINIYGALAGSYPIGGNYCAYTLPNWATKFLADSFLQKLDTNNNIKFLG